MRGRREIVERLIADVAPKRSPVDFRAADRRARGFDRRSGARKTHPEPAAAKACGRYRQRPAAPLVDEPDRVGAAAVDDARRLGFRPRQALERDLGQHTERAERARHQPRHVEACDVLDHLAAEGQRFAGAVDDAHAEDEIAHGAGMRAPGTREACRDDAGERRVGAVVRRLECKHLSVRGERVLDFGERRRSTRRHDELPGRVCDDAAKRANVQRIARERFPVEILRAAAVDAQRPAVGRRGADAIPDAFDLGGLHDPVQRNASLSR